MAWAERYRARFPGREESQRRHVLLPKRGERGWPRLDDDVGGNTICRVATGGVQTIEK